MKNRAARVCLWFVAATAFSQEPPQANLPPTRPLNQRETPRGSVLGFLEAVRENDYRRASSFLDLTQSRRTGLDGAELARMLKYVLDRKLASDPGLLSNNPEGDPTDGLQPDQELLGSVSTGGKAFDLLLERVKQDEGTLVWLVSAETIAAVPSVYRNLDESSFERYLPAWLAARGPLDTPWWQWLALLMLTFVAFAAGALLARVIMRIIAPLVKRTPTSLDDALAGSLARPLQVLLALIVFRAGLVWIVPAVLLRSYLGRILTMLGYLTVAWLVSRIVDVVAAKATAVMTGRQRASASSMMPLLRRTFKVLAYTFAIVATMDAWGYDTTAILAGLGVGGVAVALAAQKTIENLFGGVAITTDKPVLVGDFCRYGDKLGIVEDVGLRSTRIRTLDRTLVTIPNGQFSALAIENFGKRDKIWFHPTLGLRRDTTPGQIRHLIAAIRQVLLDHPKVDPNPARVRFIGIGAYSMDLEIFAYVKTADIDEFLLIQEELLLSMLDVIEAAGTALAVPQQLTLLARDPVETARRAAETVASD